MKYIWIIGQRIDNNSYSINFLFTNFTSQILIDTLLKNRTNNNQSNDTNYGDKQLKIIRFSLFNNNGQFLNEYLSTIISPWQRNIIKIALNMLRYTAASTLLPKQHRMLSYFDSITTTKDGDFENTSRPEGRAIAAKILALSNAISAGAKAWTDVVNAFKTSSSTTVTRITRFGFNHFAQKSTVLKAINIPASRATEFINAITIDYNLPSKGALHLD